MNQNSDMLLAPPTYADDEHGRYAEFKLTASFKNETGLPQHQTIKLYDRSRSLGMLASPNASANDVRNMEKALDFLDARMATLESAM
jgi:hypothetical protein